MKSYIKTITLLSSLLMKFSFANSNKPYYNEKEILSETHWKEMNIFPNAPSHLSVISQGRFDEGLYDKYDKNYYYPASAGEGVDVYMIDTGFNFLYEEFSEANAKVDFVIEHLNVTQAESEKVYYDGNMLNHGSATSMAVVGKTVGVARKVNIHGVGINLQDKNDKDQHFFIDKIISWLEYLKKNEKLVNPYKTVINISLCDSTTVDEFNKGKFKYAQDLINDISEMGVVFVAAAGNYNVQPYDKDHQNIVYYPCAFDNVICVGGVGNFNSPGIMKDEIDSSYYTLARHNVIEILKTNFGKGVDIYAPFVFHFRGDVIEDQITKELGINESIYGVEVEDSEYGKVFKNLDTLFPGTSMASPIVAGVAATFMSEYPEKKFTSTSMLKFLTEIGEKDIIQGVPNDCPNVFINNGKKVIYDADIENNNNIDLDNEIEVEVNTEDVKIDDGDESDFESDDE